jgi:hypothetical protein
MFERHKEHKAQVAAERAAQVAEQAAQAAAQAAAQTDALLGWCIDRTRDLIEQPSSSASVSLPLKAGERAVYELAGAQLVEPRRGAGHWQGGTQGVSVRIPGTRSARYRVGSTRGHYVQGEENPTVIDTGTLTITTKRAVFLGSKQSREWQWAKLTGIHDEPGVAWTSIGVSNRQKVSGIAYPTARATEVRFYLELAVAAANGTTGEMLAELQDERAKLVHPAGGS